MALRQVLIVTGVLGACGACGFAAHRWHRRRQAHARERADHEQARARRLEQCMAGVWSEARPLIADVTEDLSGPADTKAHSDNGRMVQVHLTPVSQRNAWTTAKFLAVEGQTRDRDFAARMILSLAVAPDCDWSYGWHPYAEDPRYRQVYESVALLLDLAELALKYAPRGATAGRGALLCTGWVHEPPAPSKDARPGDYVEVLIDEFSLDPEDASPYAEWAWVRVEKVGPTGELVGSITHDAPSGKIPYVLQHSAQHGLSDQTPVTVPRRCVFQVVSGR